MAPPTPQRVLTSPFALPLLHNHSGSRALAAAEESERQCHCHMCLSIGAVPRAPGLALIRARGLRKRGRAISLLRGRNQGAHANTCATKPLRAHCDNAHARARRSTWTSCSPDLAQACWIELAVGGRCAFQLAHCRPSKVGGRQEAGASAGACLWARASSRLQARRQSTSLIDSAACPPSGQSGAGRR